jgi:hypothetical protein
VFIGEAGVALTDAEDAASADDGAEGVVGIIDPDELEGTAGVEVT